MPKLSVREAKKQNGSNSKSCPEQPSGCRQRGALVLKRLNRDVRHAKARRAPRNRGREREVVPSVLRLVEVAFGGRLLPLQVLDLGPLSAEGVDRFVGGVVLRFQFFFLNQKGISVSHRGAI